MKSETETREENRTCEKHGDYVSTIKMQYLMGKPFREWDSRCPTCEAEIAEEWRIREAKQEREQRASKQRSAGIPARFANCTFDNYVVGNPKQRKALDTAKAFAENFKARQEAGNGLVFCGSVGSGKTHLGCAIANHLLDCGRTALYVTVSDLIREIRDTWRHESRRSESSVIARYREVGLLILDEIGVQFSTENERNQLFDVLDARYREMRPTIIASNLNGAGLKECLGERLFDRLTEVGSAAVVTFDWPSYRREKHVVRSVSAPAIGGIQ